MTTHNITVYPEIEIDYELLEDGRCVQTSISFLDGIKKHKLTSEQANNLEAALSACMPEYDELLSGNAVQDNEEAAL